jgi:hypothetical protein
MDIVQASHRTRAWSTCGLICCSCNRSLGTSTFWWATSTIRQWYLMVSLSVSEFTSTSFYVKAVERNYTSTCTCA